MEILVLKDEKVFAHFSGDDATYTLVTIPKEEVPVYPAELAGIGKQWELEYIDGMVQWIEKDRPLTTEEKLEYLQQEVKTIKYEWKVGESVILGDKRYFNGAWYECLQSHTTQSDWTPDIAVSLWKLLS